jgi:hypothetical protein
MDKLVKLVEQLRRDVRKLTTILTGDQVIPGMKSKGSMCSANGKHYENTCYENIKHSPKITGQGGGSSHKPDIYTQNGHIECKPENSPDWGQCILKWEDERWVPTNLLFQKYMDQVKFKPPPFLSNKITYSEWIKIKHDYNDEYLDVGEREIQDFYKNKGCAYIQIKGRGLYHLGEDPLEWGVPEFFVKQRMRIRVKVHSRSDSNLSVTAAFQPLDIKTLEPSEYSLDDSTRLPPNL